MSHDFAHNPVADANRADKARALASWCWDRGITGTQLEAAPETIWNKAARDAGINAPSEWTIAATVDLLDQRSDWAEAHPDDPRATSPGLPLPPWWDGGPPVLTIVRDAPAPAVGEWVTPRGWEALAGLGQLNRTDAPCATCGARPVVVTPRSGHCAKHPPQPGTGDWGASLDWTPDRNTGRCAEIGRQGCYCGRCPSYPRPRATTPLAVAQ